MQDGSFLPKDRLHKTSYTPANYKITYPTEILGYALPYLILFLIIGFVVDLIASKTK